MDTKHTPGPWRVEESETGWIVGANSLKGADYIADVHKHVGGSSNDERDESNAKLIAAAPELLEALKVAQKAIDLALCGTPSKHYFADLKQKLGAKGYTLEDNLSLNMQDIKAACSKAHAKASAAIAKATA